MELNKLDGTVSIKISDFLKIQEELNAFKELKAHNAAIFSRLTRESMEDFKRVAVQLHLERNKL